MLAVHLKHLRRHHPVPALQVALGLAHLCQHWVQALAWVPRGKIATERSGYAVPDSCSTCLECHVTHVQPTTAVW